MKQLTCLLKTANIPIPSGPFITCLGKKKLKWSGIKGSSSITEKVSDEENSLHAKNVETIELGCEVDNDCANTKGIIHWI